MRFCIHGLRSFLRIQYVLLTCLCVLDDPLSNTHLIDRFLDKDEIKIDDIFSDVCEVQHISPQTLPHVEPKEELDIGLRPILNRTMSMAHCYSIDGSTLRFLPTKQTHSASTNYQFVTRLFITKWIDSLIWINPSL